MAGCALLVESSPGTGTTHPPHPALLRPSPCNPTSIRRQVLRLLYGSGTGSLSCLSFARAYFVVPLYQYMRKRETHHYLFVASFNAQTTLPHVSSLGGTIPSVCRPDATGSIFLQNAAAPTTKEQSQLSIVTRHGNSAANTETSKRLKRKRTERELDLITDSW